MSELKAGTKIVLNDRVYCGSSFIEKGVTGILLQDFNDFNEHLYVQFDVFSSSNLHDAHGLGEQGKCWSVNKKLLSIYNDYESSNRFKLKQAIKETGISSRKLSHFAVGNESYFYNYTGKARFDEKGDITEERLNSLLTTLAFAERELLGIGAKTVDDNPIIDKTSQSDTDNEIDEDLKESIEDSEIKDQNKLYSEYFDSANKRIQQKKDAKVRNFLIVFLVFVVILSIYFLTR